MPESHEALDACNCQYKIKILETIRDRISG